MDTLTRGVAREAQFFGCELAARCPRSVLPASFYAHVGGLGSEYVLLMEEVLGVGGNMAFGNQVWGVPADVRPPAPAVDVLQAAFVRAAALHSAFFRDPLLLAQGGGVVSRGWAGRVGGSSGASVGGVGGWTREGWAAAVAQAGARGG